MEEPEGALSFDFEGGLETVPTNPSSAVPLLSNEPTVAVSSNLAPSGPGPTVVGNGPDQTAGNHPGRRSFRQTVCRHWLRSLCMKGDACGFLHQYDKARMPVCRFFRLYGECREQDCVYKHTNEDIKECNMYKLGFCPNGPDCRYRHAKMPGPPPPVEELFQKIQQMSSFSYGSSNRFFQHRNNGYTQQAERPQFPQGSSVSNHGMGVKPSTAAESSNVEQEQPQIQPQVNQAQMQNLPNGSLNQVNRTTLPALPQGQSRYFIVKSCNRENLELSVQQGVWATQRNNEAKLNEAFDSSENVILIFSVNRTCHFQGCAKMTSKIGGFVGGGNWKYAHGTAHYGRNFSVKWLKLCELSFHKTRHLRNPYNENLPVKISRDCQELEPSIGEQLASLLFLEPDSELTAILVAAETKREEEKAKGVNPDDGAKNPDIVPFEDNEEEEEEESEEEDESFGQTLNPAQGRGRGRGAMWPPHMPLARGGRLPPGVRGFPPMMMGVDGFSYGAVTPDGFTMPDLFGVGPRAFAPYGSMGPRFPGNFPGLNQNSAMGFSQPGAVFPGGGLGMMMGSGRPPFMGGMGMGAAAQARPNWPMGLPQFRPPPPLPQQVTARAVKRDPKSSGNDRYTPNSDPGKGQEISALDEDAKYSHVSKARHEDSFVAGNSFRNDESESEDEAPRRSRHGEGKKKRRGSEGEGGSDHWEMPVTEHQNP
ncbi:30-kDa cleavage and polyadenylation specificity factor 30-like [Tasmannia lanceolata]|uniref:30-kDa cleavage and polyadenylation specificity factor 30-like n=1 Tax=Tasmannia lanceolata TaxID=3420 RepID=UPI00406293B6